MESTTGSTQDGEKKFSVVERDVRECIKLFNVEDTSLLDDIKAVQDASDKIIESPLRNNLKVRILMKKTQLPRMIFSILIMKVDLQVKLPQKMKLKMLYITMKLVKKRISPSSQEKAEKLKLKV